MNGRGAHSVEPCYVEAINPSAAQPLAGDCVDTGNFGEPVESAGKWRARRKRQAA